MPEFRIEGVTGEGKPLQGVLEAESLKSAKQKATQMARSESLSC